MGSGLTCAEVSSVVDGEVVLSEVSEVSDVSESLEVSVVVVVMEV